MCVCECVLIILLHENIFIVYKCLYITWVKNLWLEFYDTFYVYPIHLPPIYVTQRTFLDHILKYFSFHSKLICYKHKILIGFYFISFHFLIVYVVKVHIKYELFKENLHLLILVT